MTEDAFWDEFQFVRNDIYEATLSWHAYLKFSGLIANDKALLEALNRNASFWLVTSTALRQNAILSMGRLFDRDRRSRSLGKIVEACVQNPTLFSREALRRRKLKTDFKIEEADWLATYIEKAFVPDVEHLQKLEAEFNGLAEIWRTTYQPIRHRVVAHRDKLTQEELDGLFGATRIGEITELLERLFTVEEAIWSLAMNAKPLDFSKKVNPRLKEIENATQGVLDSIPRPQIDLELRKALSKYDIE